MSNLIYLARSGLNSAQSALHVVGNNLNNAFTPGYSRQNIMLGEAGGKTTNYGFFGYGVQVDNVQRAYDSFINNQYRNSASGLVSEDSRYKQLTDINNMLGDDTVNISTSLDGLFKSLEKVSGNPADKASRQETLAQLKALSNRFQSNNSTLNGLEKSTNRHITQSVDDINATTGQLAKLNQEIAKIHAQTGGSPADLLDQRDRLLDKLSEQVGIKVDENPATGEVNVTMSNGMPLVNRDKSYQFTASASPEDPNKTIVSYIDASGNAIKLDESKLTTGKLGGLFKFRNEDLVDARNQLNQIALQMANKFNEVNQAGYDRNGNPGGALFDFSNPSALANRNNSGNASFDVVYSDISQVNAQDYTITYKGPGADDWEVTRADGSKVAATVAGGKLEFDGISMQLSGTPEPGDSFCMNPVAGVADSLTVAITDGDEVAASSSNDPSEESNNENIKKLIAIKDERLIGKSTLTEAYASLVSSVGSSMTSLKSNLETSAKAMDAIIERKQGISGVDLNEEFVNMNMFQQYYQANAQILQTANTLFDTLLNIK
ncbi:MAG: flagellar hook-associated protein FlgK [Enterobacteriaceae bacterium]